MRDHHDAHDGGGHAVPVKILLITAHREKADRREIWQGGRLVAYSSTTVENGKTIKIDANAAGAKLAINGPAGATTAPGGTFTTNPWNVAILKAATVMDSKTGAVKPVSRVENNSGFSFGLGIAM